MQVISPVYVARCMQISIVTNDDVRYIVESIKEAKRNGIEFTKEEVYSMCTELSKNLPEKNRRQVEKLLKML